MNWKWVFVLWIFGLTAIEAQSQNSISWNQSLRQHESWYQSQEAIRIADNVLLYQLDCGGWPKNIDMAQPLSESEKENLIKKKSQTNECTIDNGATFTQLAFLAKVYNATQLERFKNSFITGLNFLLDLQYENGGWPQYPDRKGYYSHITFNDNAMIGVMNLLKNIAEQEDYSFVSDDIKSKIKESLQKGIDCILKCQVVVDGQKTVWCAQHDENTLEPAPARTYEKISLSGSESVGIVRFLMGIENPSDEVIDAVESAVQWFKNVKITGIKQVQKPDPSLPRGYDRVVVSDPDAPPLWARFYQIGTNRPIFCGRDGIIKYSLAEIEHERRVGYSWYTNAPARLLEKDYPTWKKRISQP